MIFLVLAGTPRGAFGAGGEGLKDLEVGQEFLFRAAWNGIPVAFVTTKVEELTEIQGRPAYKVVARARTNRWASLFYEVDDTFISYIDRETSSSLRYEAYRSEGRYRKKAVINYIYGRFLANYHYLKDGTKKTVKVKENVQDPLSAAYFFLRKDFSIGDTVALNIDLNEKHYRLYTKIEKGHRIHLPRIGGFGSVRTRPYLLRKGRPYKRGNGYGYISIGEDRLPLFAVVTVFIWGRFSATLQAVRR
jgi:hypothetical protein